MEKRQRFALRKTTMGLVSAAIMGITVVPLFGSTAFAQEDNAAVKVDTTQLEVAQPSARLHTKWTANTVSEIKQQIDAQLGNQKAESEDDMRYEIQWGDTVWGITQAFELDQDAFVEANDIENPDLIITGDVVTLDLENAGALTRQAGTNVAETEDDKTMGEAKSAPTVETEIQTKDKVENSAKADEVVVEDAEAGTTETENVKADETETDETVEKESKEVAETPVADEITQPTVNETVAPAPKEDVVDVDIDDSGNFSVVDEETKEKEDAADNSQETGDNENKEDVVVEDEPEQDVEEEVIDEEIIEEEPETSLPEDEAETDGDLINEEVVEETPVTPEAPVEDEDEIVEDVETPGDETEVEDGEGEPTEEVPEQDVEDEVEEQDVIVNRTINRTFAINHGTKYVEDDTLPTGEQKVVQEGQNGVLTRTYSQKVVNDKVESETLVSETVTTEAVDRIIHVGTQTREVKREVVSQNIPFETVRKENPEMEVGLEVVVQDGLPGSVQRTYETVYVNGKPQGERTLVDETVVSNPVNKVIEYGTKEVVEDEPADVYAIDTQALNQEILGYINAERTRLGAGALFYDAELQSGTSVRADDLQAIGGLTVDGVGHVRPDGSDWREAFDYLDVNPLYHLGENIAYNWLDMGFMEQVEAGERTLENALAEMFYTQYYRSPGHYANMVNEDFTGFATDVRISENGQVFNVQIFSTDRN